MTNRERRLDAALGAAVFAGCGAAFWLGRSRSYGMGDSPQHVLAALLWAVPHPPGYPLLTALGWLWSRLPWSDPGAAVNGLSGLLAASAAAVLFALLRRAGARRAAALTGSLLMAFAPLFWYYALVAEARALNDLLALGAAYFAFDWSRGGKPRALALFSLLFGLGLAHHPSFVFLTPAFVVWLAARRPSRRLAAACAALTAAGLAGPYLLLGLRLSLGPPAYSLFEVAGWRDLWPLFTRRALGGPLRLAAGAPALGLASVDLARLGAHLGWFASSLWTHAGPAGLALAALGAASHWKGARRDLAAWALWLTASAGTYAVFSSAQMPAVDPEYARAVAVRFHLLPMIAVFALAGFGAEALARRVRPALAYALLAGAVAAPLARPLSLAHSDPLLGYTRALVRDSAPGDFIVLGSDDTIFAALDLELVRGEGARRVFLCPTMFGFPPYLRRLARTYPDVRLPPAGPRGLTTDWALWKRLNAGRAVLAEPSLRGVILRDFPRSVPQGSMIRVESAPARSDPADDARRFLGAPETFSFTRADSRPWTQEVYLLQARASMAAWLASRLDPVKDRELRDRLERLLEQL